MGARLFRQKIMLYTSDRNNTYAHSTLMSHVAGSKVPWEANVMGKVRDPRIGARPAVQAALKAEGLLH